MLPEIHKYPRTRHIDGSRLQPGDEDLSAVPFKQLAGRHLVIEEKVDGANAGIRFDPDGKLLLQSRGHYLTGGGRERHFDLFKQWAHERADALRPVLGDRYVLYGEWLYAKHTVFYDELPSYFMEFDVLDTVDGSFLDTPRRAELLRGVPLTSVRVLFSGTLERAKELTAKLGRSAFISERHLERLRESCAKYALDPEGVLRETDASTMMEGLYIKVEEAGVVRERFKYIRAGFLSAVVQSETHWLNRPIIPNRLCESGLGAV
jgi:hypothetical protein